MRRFAGSMAVALAAVVIPVAAYAGASGSGALVLVGVRSASITVVLHSELAVGDPFRLDAAAKGSYAGYVISDTNGRVLAGSVVVRGVGMATGDGVPLGFADRPLRPGRYVVTLLADGPARVVVPLSGAARITLRPTLPARVFARVLHNDVVPSTAVGSPLAYSETAVPAGHHQLASLTQFFAGIAAQAGESDQCFTTLPVCQLGGDGGSSDYLSPGLGGSSSYSGMGMSPADFVAGTRAVLDSADVAVEAQHAGFVLILG